MPKIFGKRWRLRRSDRQETQVDPDKEKSISPIETDLVEKQTAPQINNSDRLLATMEAEIEGTIQRLSGRSFDPDPLAGPHFSKMVSLFSSAYKRHGNILEGAIRERLKHEERFEVWTEPAFTISQKTASIVAKIPLNNVDPIQQDLPYGNSDGGTLQVDILVWDSKDKSLRAYEVKRGHGRHDAGKIRSIKRELYKIDILLKSYGVSKGFAPSVVSSHVIFYYGNRSIDAPLGLRGEDLDAHFGMSVHAEVEEVNRHFRRRLFEILADQ